MSWSRASGKAVTDVDALTLARASRRDLLDSPSTPRRPASGTNTSYSESVDKAAVFAVRPRPQALTMFCALNGRELCVSADDAVETMLKVAEGELDEAAGAA